VDERIVVALRLFKFRANDTTSKDDSFHAMIPLEDKTTSQGKGYHMATS
jgi:hypothetical protein